MANVDVPFEKFRGDLIAHLSTRLGLAPDVVASRLKGWLLDRGRSSDQQEELKAVRPLRVRR